MPCKCQVAAILLNCVCTQSSYESALVHIVGRTYPLALGTEKDKTAIPGISAAIALMGQALVILSSGNLQLPARCVTTARPGDARITVASRLVRPPFGT